MVTTTVVLSLVVLLLAAAVALLGAHLRRQNTADLYVRTLLDERHQAQQEAAATRAELDASGYRALVGSTVIASIIDGGSIRGVLTAVYEDAIVLSHPVYVAGATPAGMGGEITLARSRVPSLQRHDESTTA